MASTGAPLLERLETLGLTCDHISLDQVSPATAALACFPMYMVANAHLWDPNSPAATRLLNIPGVEELREAFAISRQTAAWDLAPEHRQVLSALLVAPKPSDRATYEYALATLKDLLAVASPELAETLRNGVARTMIAVAHASGDGLLGTGERISDAERTCIRRIASELELERAEAAAWLLERLGE